MSSIKHCLNNVAISLRVFKKMFSIFKNKRSLRKKPKGLFDGFKKQVTKLKIL